MYQEQLPINCPPNNTKEIEQSLFRIIKNRELFEFDFYSYYKLYPENKRYKNLCIAHALSFYLSLEDVTKAYNTAKENNKSLGNYAAELLIKKNFGTAEINRVTKHCSLWLYKDFNYKIVECIQVKSLNEN